MLDRRRLTGCPANAGHPRLVGGTKAWTAGTSPAMTMMESLGRETYGTGRFSRRRAKPNSNQAAPWMISSTAISVPSTHSPDHGRVM